MFPGLRDLVLKVVASHSVTSTTHTAIQGLLDIIKESGKPAKPRERWIRPVWVESLLKLAIAQSRAAWRPVHRNQFMTLPGNDFSVLTRWGMVEQGHIRGTWTITKLGIRFLMDRVSVPAVVRFNGNASDPKWSFDHHVKWIKASEYLDITNSQHCLLFQGLQSREVPRVSMNVALSKNNGMWVYPSWAV